MDRPIDLGEFKQRFSEFLDRQIAKPMQGISNFLELLNRDLAVTVM